MSGWVLVLAVMMAAAVGSRLGGRTDCRHCAQRGTSAIWLPNREVRTDSPGRWVRTVQSVASWRLCVGRLAVRVIAIPCVAAVIALALYGYRAVALAEPILDAGQFAYSLVRSSRDDRPTVEFLEPTKPLRVCGLFNVAIRVDNADRQRFLAVRDRTLNRLHNVLRILPDGSGRYDAELGAYFGDGEYDIVVMTPRGSATEQSLRSAEAAAGGPSPSVEGLAAPDAQLAYFDYGPSVHVPPDCGTE